PFLLEPFPPSAEGALRQPLFPAELLHGHSAAPLGSDSFGPLVCFRVGRLRLDDSVAHDTRMQRRPVRRKSRSRDAYPSFNQVCSNVEMRLEKFDNSAHAPASNYAASLNGL